LCVWHKRIAWHASARSGCWACCPLARCAFVGLRRRAPAGRIS
jgi:hypothetical protein